MAGILVGVLHPGEMGSALGAALRSRDTTVLWASEGRSAATRGRAEEDGLEDAGSTREIVRRADLVVSVCPPHAAHEVASSVVGFRGLYVDANAVSPATAREIGSAIAAGGGRFVDGGIVGPPPRTRGTTRLYLSGPDADEAASVFSGTVVDARAFSDRPGDASALKMAYAAVTKGQAALLLAARSAAQAYGVEAALLDEWSISLPELKDDSARAARSAAAKGWRWIGEMEEIAATFAAAGLPDGFHRAAAEVFRGDPLRVHRRRTASRIGLVSIPGLARPPQPQNEPVKNYAPGSPERVELQAELRRMAGERIEATHVIGGDEVKSSETFEAVMPHDKDHVLADVHSGGAVEVERAIKASADAWHDWSRTPWEERAAVFLRAAELLAGPWRQTLNAATMLGQSKTAHQAEIDAACELTDFFRFNVEFMLRIYAEQPESSSGTWNRMEYRPLEGFVFAVTPFNFTAIGGNLPTSAALMGDTVVWKPASTAALSAHYLMRLFQEAGLPPGVINLVYGGGAAIGDPALASPDLAGVHFTGSTPVFQSMWKTIGSNIASYRNYPRIVGETGGKDFIVAHPTAEAEAVATAIVRGSFEYQGQKCSAASRLYIADNIWPEVRERLVADIGSLRMGDVTDFENFMGAVIDAKALKTHRDAIELARSEGDAEILVGGNVDDSEGFFVEPTVIETRDPRFPLMRDELFGPIVTAYVYPQSRWRETLELVDDTAPYALTGAVFARDRRAIEEAHEELEYAAGNFYVNDKPTGAVVGQQPFGGARASGTNDKAGSMWNLIRWVTPRTIKETFVPPRDYRYPFMAPDLSGDGSGPPDRP